jgi:DNA-binding HxlR family transcriptional regulator
MPNNVPLPGRPVRGSTTGRPVMAAMDLLGRRWSLRLVWELRDGSIGPRALLERCEGLSSSVLYQRLGELVAARVVHRSDGQYALTRYGESLGKALDPLNQWAVRWSRALDSPPARE